MEQNVIKIGDNKMFELMEDHNEEAVIKVIGVGGGGGNAVEHMVLQTIEGAVSYTHLTLPTTPYV